MNLSQRVRLIHRAWRYRLRAERREIAFVRAVIRPGDCVLDIGAHKAAFTYWMAKRVGDRGHVFAFEPNPSLAQYLGQVADDFPRGRIHVVEAALSNRQGRAELHFPGEHLGSASLELIDDVLRAPISVRALTLDDYLASIHWQEPVRLIKCDVEYHELAALQGSVETLNRDQPVLLVESGDFVQERFRLTPLQSFMDDQGYIGFFFHDSDLVRIEDFDARRHPPVDDDHQNYVFVAANSKDSHLQALLNRRSGVSGRQRVA